MENKEIFVDKESSRIVFHFNKKHNEDPKVPTWIVKHKGVTYYVDHLESLVGFKTKETPENDHTKGAIQFKGRLKILAEGTITTAYVL
jgi:hypothetical protein